MGLASRHIATAKRSPIKNLSDGLSIILPCAGLGTRLKTIGVKSLISLNDKTLIERQLTTIWKVYPDAHIIITIGNQDERMRNFIHGHYPVSLIYNKDFAETNVVYSLSLALQATTSKNVLIIYGDLLFNKYALYDIGLGNSKVVMDSKGQFEKDEVGIIDDKKLAENFRFGLPKKWAQIVYLKETELKIFEKYAFDPNCRTWFGYEILNKIIEEGGQLNVIENPKTRIVEIDKPNDITRANDLAKEMDLFV